MTFLSSSWSRCSRSVHRMVSKVCCSSDSPVVPLLLSVVSLKLRMLVSARLWVSSAPMRVLRSMPDLWEVSTLDPWSSWVFGVEDKLGSLSCSWLALCWEPEYYSKRRERKNDLENVDCYLHTVIDYYKILLSRGRCSPSNTMCLIIKFPAFPSTPFSYYITDS